MLVRMSERADAVTFEHESTPDYVVAQTRWMYHHSPMMADLLKKQMFVFNLVWSFVTASFVFVALAFLHGVSVSVAVASVIAGSFNFAFTRFRQNGKRNRRFWEKYLLKRTAQAEAKNPRSNPGHMWRYTVSGDTVEYEDLTSGNSSSTKTRGIERADLVDGHLCIGTDGMISGSLPMAGVESEADVERIRAILRDAGVAGWPSGEAGLPPSPLKKRG